MGRQRNNPQLKGKEESTEKELNEIKASNQAEIEFKIMVARMLQELRTTGTVLELQGT